MTQHLNIWFTPRSRSTALLRCLSNIENSKVYPESFMWTNFYRKADSDGLRTSGRFDFENYTPDGFTYKTVLEQYMGDKSHVKIVKDYFFTLEPEDYDKVITKDSINIVLIRNPANTITSTNHETRQVFYDFIRPGNIKGDVDFVDFYSSLLDVIEYVHEHCTRPAHILTGELFYGQNKLSTCKSFFYCR